MKDLIKKIKPYLPYLIALIGGGILTYAFAPYDIGIAGIISLSILLWAITKQPPKKAFYIGWCYGLGMFGMGVNWVFFSIHVYGNTAPWLAAIITGLFVILMGIYPALFSWTLNKFFNKHDLVRTLVIFPALWTVFEIARGWLFTGFPWLYLGYSQMGSQLHSFAPIGSVFAVSWAAALVSSLLYNIIMYYFENKSTPKLRNQLFATLLGVWVIAFGCGKIKGTEVSDEVIEVALVQGNIPQMMRWDPEHVANIVQTYRTLTDKVLGTTQIIVWPEGAIPVPLPESQQFFREMGALARASQAALISGVPTQLADQRHYYNSIVAVGLAGPNNNGCENYEMPGCSYDKSHLVPFGEYVPFESILRGIIAFLNLPMSSFVEGPSNQSPLIAQGLHFAPALCYEIAYPFYVQHISKEADFILTISNDTWFGDTIGPLQHLQIAQFRALETGKYVIRGTNNGYTALIQPNGKIQALANPNEATVLAGEVTLMKGQTIWVRFGIWPLLAALVLTLGGGYYWQDRKRMKLFKAR
ncbi:MAG: apolipoprotein N-acyltransferase [Proteobacteria bacterium]|nr:apolipoprotein N-acyltransferase [Pseudomonadota bacterium]